MEDLIVATDNLYTRWHARFTSTLASALGQMLRPDQMHVAGRLSVRTAGYGPLDYKIQAVVS